MIEMLDVIKKRLRPEKGQVLVFSILLLPLVLGILALVVEMGNLYVHYWNLQHAADTAVLTLDASKAKEVADKNNLKPKRYINVTGDTDPFKIETSTCSDENNFYVKLEKTVPSFFERVFGEGGFRLPPVYAAASKNPPKLTTFTTDPKSLTWVKVE